MYLSVKQVAEKLNITERQVRNLCAQKKISGAIKIDNF